MSTYRTGTHQPQNVYRDDAYIGVMFTAEDAALVVEAMNEIERAHGPARPIRLRPAVELTHRPERRGSDSEGYGACTACGELWPCDNPPEDDVNWTREQFEQDKQRYQRELDALLAEGLRDDDFRVRRLRRRIETVGRVLTDPRYGLTEGGDA